MLVLTKASTLWCLRQSPTTSVLMCTLHISRSSKSSDFVSHSMINCAGIAPELKDPQPIWQSSKSSWTSTMHVNTTAVWSGCRAASAQMMKQPPRTNGDRGWIINLSSIYGLTATAGNGKTSPSVSYKSPTDDRPSGLLFIEACRHRAHQSCSS
jgi:NAD(P)-dependent dehydrogenase (short-subunit alcohol dehydrogenase family)